jgi:hypothetical protein
MPECRIVRHPGSPVPGWTKIPMPEPVRYRNNGTSLIPECSGTGLRSRMPECRCRRHQPRCRSMFLMFYLLLFGNILPLCLSEHKKVKYFLDFSRIREKRKRKTKLSQVRPLYGPFWSKSAKIRVHLFPAAPLFIRPLFSNAAEQSISWQHRLNLVQVFIPGLRFTIRTLVKQLKLTLSMRLSNPFFLHQ